MADEQMRCDGCGGMVDSECAADDHTKCGNGCPHAHKLFDGEIRPPKSLLEMDDEVRDARAKHDAAMDKAGELLLEAVVEATALREGLREVVATYEAQRHPVTGMMAGLDGGDWLNIAQEMHATATDTLNRPK